MALLMAAGSAVGSKMLDSSFKAADSVTDYYFGGKKEKRSNERNQRITAQDRYQNFLYDLLEKNYDYTLQKKAYDYSNEEQYRLAEKYAQNSASWQVAGLRKAGLNPILAATNGNFGSTFGSTGSMSAGGGSSSGSHTSPGNSNWNTPAGRVDLSEALRDISSAKQMTTDTEIKRNTQSAVESRIANDALRSAYDVQSAKQNVSKVEADTALVRAEAAKAEATARQIDSSTALNLVRADNESDNGGVSSWPGLASSLLRALLPDFRDSNTARKAIHQRIKKDVEPQITIPYHDVKDGGLSVPHVYPSVGPDGIKYIGAPKSLPRDHKRHMNLHTR